MVVILHRSDRPLALADEFAALLAAQPLDVFTPESVVVGARGVERWLTQRLSHRLGTSLGEDGVCAGLEVRSPASLTALLLGRERDDPWHADRLVWAVLEALDAGLGAPEFEVVARHLGAGPEAASPDERWQQRARRGRRYAVARRVAGLFASHARERPQVLADWEAGLFQDGAGQPLAEDLHWQPMLWRATVDLVRERGLADESPVARHERVVAELRSGSGALPGMPGRLSLFGHTRLGEAELDLLDALSTRIDVHLWLPHPSPQLWTALRERTGLVPRAQDDSGVVADHPLLASLGRDVRELQRSLLSREVVDATPASDMVVGDEPRTRLQLLQHDVRANVAPSALPLAPASDRSIQVHACHGPARQVEVLRELLVALLDDSHGALQPRDILVMCPDVETFAPLIHATFGLRVERDETASSGHPGTHVRVQLADRALAATNPLVEVAERVLDLVSGRMTAAEILDLLALPAVRRRFHLDEDDLEKVARWVAEASVRWGVDGTHRREYGLDGLVQNTWEAGLDRLALGVAVSADSRGDAGLLLPLDDVGSNDIPLAGGMLELLAILTDAAARVRTGDGAAEPGTMATSAWITWLRETVLRLADVPSADRWQIAQLERELSLVGETASSSTRLRLTDVRVMVQQRWAARPTRSNFRTGAVTVCTMVPMRSVPHRVVIALGLDDGVFPRSPVVDGDDVLARRPLTGERDPRTEDAQLLLDAVMAAQETFIALYSGFDERTGSRRPPAVPLQELIAAAGRTGVGPDEADADEDEHPPFLHLHPLQAFDERNFGPSSFLPGGTYDGHALAGARALREAHRAPQERPPLVPGPLPQTPESAVSLEDLVAFYENPAREFLRRRLGITVPRAQEDAEIAIPIDVGGLDEWKIGDRVLRQVRSGMPLPQALAAERRRGEVPPDPLADPVLQKVGGTVQEIVASASPEDHETVGILVDLPSGVRVRGVVTDVVGDVVETLTYSTVSAKHLVGAWVRLLAVAVARPETAWRSVVRAKRGSEWLTAPSAEVAAEVLDTLVAFRAKGMQFPLGLPPKTASAYTKQYEMRLRRDPEDRAAAVHAGMREAERVWAGSRFPERNDDPWWARLYGPTSSAADIDAGGTLQYWGPLVWSPIHAAGGRA